MAFTFGQPEDRAFKLRLRIAYFVGVFFFLLLGTRLWYLQLFRGEFYRHESEQNSIRVKEIVSPRGMIRDRFGKLIIDNKPNYIVSIVPEDVSDLASLAEFIGSAVSIPTEQIVQKVRKTRGPRFRPIPIKRGLDWVELARLETHRHDYPGLEIEVDSRRSYIYGSIAPHFLGYLSEINSSELEALNKRIDAGEDRYQQGDHVGKGGIEKAYQKQLRGREGYKTVRVDSHGREIAELARVEPEPGLNLNLTLDLELQLYARELFKDKVGVLLALNPQNGEILAIVNAPSYDPEMWSGGISQKNWEMLRDDPNHPLVNRAIRGQYPPGSTYKIITAAAGLEEGVINERSTVTCNGSFRYGNRTFRCWKKGGHGKVDVKKALVESCDVFFYELAEKLGINKLAEYARHLGLGKPTGIDVEGEKGGIVPTPEWKKKRFGQPWYPGETIPITIGQGYNLTTPLQVAVMYGAVGMNGKVYQPHLLRSVSDYQGNTVFTYEPKQAEEFELSKKTARILRDGLDDVVNDRKGTAYWYGRLPFPDIRMAGKTGTAQVVNYKAGERSGDIEDHAWFAGFAPVDNPEIAAVALVENGGSGSSAASPLVRALIQKYFELKAERAGIPPTDLTQKGAATVNALLRGRN